MVGTGRYKKCQLLFLTLQMKKRAAMSNGCSGHAMTREMLFGVGRIKNKNGME